MNIKPTLNRYGSVLATKATVCHQLSPMFLLRQFICRHRCHWRNETSLLFSVCSRRPSMPFTRHRATCRRGCRPHTRGAAIAVAARYRLSKMAGARYGGDCLRSIVHLGTKKINKACLCCIHAEQMAENDTKSIWRAFFNQAHRRR